MLLDYFDHSVIHLTSYYLLSKKIFIDFPGFRVVQRNLYYTQGFIDIWQNKVECVAYDDELIYVPKIGSCRHQNAEFDTRPNFTKEGRYKKKISNPEKRPI